MSAVIGFYTSPPQLNQPKPANIISTWESCISVQTNYIYSPNWLRHIVVNTLHYTFPAHCNMLFTSWIDCSNDRLAVCERELSRMQQRSRLTDAPWCLPGSLHDSKVDWCHPQRGNSLSDRHAVLCSDEMQIWWMLSHISHPWSVFWFNGHF